MGNETKEYEVSYKVVDVGTYYFNATSKEDAERQFNEMKGDNPSELVCNTSDREIFFKYVEGIK